MTSKTRLAVATLCIGAVVSGIAVAGTVAITDAEKAEAARKALPVIQVNANTVTLGEFESTVSVQSPVLRQGMIDKAARDSFIEKIINLELLASEADRRGYSKNPEVVTVRKNQLATLLHRRISEKFESTPPTEEELRAFYAATNENYNKPEKIRARHIVLSDRVKAQTLLDELIKKKASQYDFRRAAQEQSEDQYTSSKGGDLTFFSRPNQRQKNDPEVDDRVINAAFAISENGGIHPTLVETDKGFHIIMRTGYRKPMSLSFEEARERLVRLVSRENQTRRVDTEIDALARKYKVELHEENLKYVVIDLSSTSADGSRNNGGNERIDRLSSDLE